MGRFLPAHPSCVTARKSGIAIDRIVIHTAEGTARGTIAWFQRGDRPVLTATHYVISRAGEITQMVPDAKRCLHAGAYNSRSIGIEHEARIDPWPARVTPSGTVLPPPFPVNDFPDEMLWASARAVAALCKAHGIPADRDHVLGHNEVPGASHRDPGVMWPWSTYMTMIEAEMGR